MSAINKATAAILNREGEYQGTGFLVGPGLVLTCAHVVGDALGNRNTFATCDERPEGNLKVRFSVTKKLITFKAQVIGQGWSRYFERSELASKAMDRFETRDLALLQLEGAETLNATPVRFWNPDSDEDLERELERNTLLAAGYPRVGEDAFNELTFEYVSRSDGNELMIRQHTTHFDGADLAGLSGAALVLKEYGLVIGIVQEVEPGQNLLVVKPASHLTHFWQSLRAVCHGCEQHQSQSKIPVRSLLNIDRESQREAIVDAAFKASERETRMVLAAISSTSDNSLHEWIDHIIELQVQYELEDDFPEWVEPIKPIVVHGPRLSVEALFKMALKKLAGKLGLRYRSQQFVDDVRHALNGGEIESGQRTEPPPYLIFQLAADNFGDRERTVLARLLQFWREVAAGELERTQLIFFALITDSDNLQDVDNSLRQAFPNIDPDRADQGPILILETLHGTSRRDAKEWIEHCSEDESWSPDTDNARHLQQVVDDIFTYEVDNEKVTLGTFQTELEKLNLIQAQEG